MSKELKCSSSQGNLVELEGKAPDFFFKSVNIWDRKKNYTAYERWLNFGFEICLWNTNRCYNKPDSRRKIFGLNQILIYLDGFDIIEVFKIGNPSNLLFFFFFRVCLCVPPMGVIDEMKRRSPFCNPRKRCKNCRNRVCKSNRHCGRGGVCSHPSLMIHYCQPQPSRFVQ